MKKGRMIWLLKEARAKEELSSSQEGGAQIAS
ncbi:hypothetical protein CCACVL1_20389 [Corchorus capsularis]|uniref:Uncharacterized protein n=1 Tax=Corchorus capsularis TaxID=210143 RepID=A0A1R3HBJ7_COCAP|nr:hypothetical protein CCACVL1_20389 [Corchorus capsularis]